MCDVGDLKYWGEGENSFQLVESGLLEGGPLPGLTFLGKEVQQCNNVGEIGDEFPMKIHKSSERSYSFHHGGRFPFLDCFKLFLVHFYLSLSYD